MRTFRCLLPCHDIPWIYGENPGLKQLDFQPWQLFRQVTIKESLASSATSGSFKLCFFFFAGELKLRKKMINGYQWMKDIFFKTYIQHNICIIWICVTNVSCLFSSADVQLSIFHSHSHRGVHRGPGHCKGPGAPHHGRHRASRAKLLSLKESMAPPFGIFQQRSFVCLMFLLVAQIGRCTPIRLTVIISQRWKLV